MTAEPIRVGVIGAGRVFQRLYQPALARLPGLELVAVADPSPEAREQLSPAITGLTRAEDLFIGAGCDAVIVLSPGYLHAVHSALALDRGLPVLLEKPSAMSSSELEIWPQAWQTLVTPSRPRRYWPRYLALRRELPPGTPFRLALRTSPAAWGATTKDSPIDDLLPHLVDLASWLSRTAVESISGDADGAQAQGLLHLSDGRTIDWTVGHGDGHEEYVEAEGVRHHLETLSIRERLEQRLLRTPAQDLLGITRMLRLWERRLRGEAVPGLPGFEIALQETRFRDQLRPGADA